jgi:putative membrane protein
MDAIAASLFKTSRLSGWQDANACPACAELEDIVRYAVSGGLEWIGPVTGCRLHVADWKLGLNWGLDMMTDLTLAALHFILILTMAGILGAEAGLVHEGMDRMQINRVAVLDRGYGAAAGLLLAAGFLRVFYGAKGAAFYLQNPIFWTKIAAFALIAVLSILPTVKFIAWHRRAQKEPVFRPAAADVHSVRRLIAARAAVLLVIPVLAGAIARGYGL